ncbi:hypothetical protein ACH5RR_036902 [Cinchona calisaya]|uniref:Uncharacterized protein n=1 Tax=Cinchona calisaya TaxID=153742 RepID=A0ABD2Y4L9_9GENT
MSLGFLLDAITGFMLLDCGRGQRLWKRSKTTIPNFGDMQSSYLVGSCNGLLCLDVYNSIILWNPWIWKILTIPNPVVQHKLSGYRRSAIQDTSSMASEGNTELVLQKGVVNFLWYNIENLKLVEKTIFPADMATNSSITTGEGYNCVCSLFVVEESLFVVEERASSAEENGNLSSGLNGKIYN